MAEPAPANYYQQLIAEIAPGSNPRYVEAWMRLEHSTLDGLSRERFQREVTMALACIAETTPSQNEALAISFGL